MESNHICTETTELGYYSVEISLLKIGGIRSTISFSNAIEIIGVDSDRDGVVDDEDRFPADPSESSDLDSDGVGDNSDAFPNDAGETADSDGDGVGDNSDAFPNNPGRLLIQTEMELGIIPMCIHMTLRESILLTINHVCSCRRISCIVTYRDCS